MSKLQARSPELGGLGEYTADDFYALDMGEFRERFPDETKALSDEQIYHVVSHQDDDLDDADWRKAFKEAATS